MPNSEYARRVSLAVTIDGADVAGALAPYLLDFTYTDNAGGKSDDLQLTLQNRDGRFSDEWMPKKGMPIEASIICRDWENPGEDLELPCGSFKIDEIEFNGPPDKVIIRAVTADLSGPLRDTQKTRAWENMSLEGVAGQIASENGMACFYSGPEHRFERQDQRNEGDIAFLNRLCSERSMNCKAHNGKIVLFDVDEAESAAASMTIYKIGDMYSPKSYSFKVSSAGTDYTDAEVAYNDPKTGTTHKARVKSAKKTHTVDNRPAKTLTVQKRVESPADAARLGKSELHRANQKEQTSNLEIMGCPKIAAGQVVGLDGFGIFSGDYFVKSAVHRVSGSGLYSTTLELAAQAMTEAETAHSEVNEAAEAAHIAADNERKARTAEVVLYEAGQYLLTESANQWLARLTSLVEDFVIKAQAGSEIEKNRAKRYEIMLCIADIAEMEAAYANKDDRKGWLYLHDMILKWLSANINDYPGKYQEPFIVDWDWVMAYERERVAYQKFIVVNEISENTIFNKAAQKSLGDILFNNTDDLLKKEKLAKILPKRTQWECENRINFDFINSPWDEWETLYYTLRKVLGSTLLLDGLDVALSNFTLRALASGYAERINEKWFINVEKIAVFVHDIFNFDESENPMHDTLGCWDCEEKGFYIVPQSENAICLNNGIFRDFRNIFGTGMDFLVLSLPHIVENFTGESYVYP